MASSMLLNRRVVAVSASIRNGPQLPGRVTLAGVAPRTAALRTVTVSASAGTPGGKPSSSNIDVPDIVIVTGGTPPPGGKLPGGGGSGGGGDAFRSGPPSGGDATPPGGFSWSQIFRWLAYIAAGAAALQLIRRYGPAAKDKVAEEGKELKKDAEHAYGVAKVKGGQAKDAVERKAHEAKEATKDAAEAAKLKAKEARDATAQAAEAAKVKAAQTAEAAKASAARGGDKIKAAGHAVGDKAEDEFHKGEAGAHEKAAFSGIKDAAGAVGRVLHIGGEKANDAAKDAKKKWNKAEAEAETTDRKKLYYAVGGTALALTAVGVGSYLWTQKPWEGAGKPGGKPFSSTTVKEPAGSSAQKAARDANAAAKDAKQSANTAVRAAAP